MSARTGCNQHKHQPGCGHPGATGGPAESGVALPPAEPPVARPPDGLVRPVPCRKCGGDGLYQYASGAPGSCAPCAGTGLVEGDRAVVRARKAYTEVANAFVGDCRAHSHEAGQGVRHLRENAPDRFDAALNADRAGDPRVLGALEDYWAEQVAARRAEVRAAVNPDYDLLTADWTPPGGPTDTPETAFDSCKRVSAAFTAHLRERGFTADWMQVVGPRGSCPDADPRWRETPQERWSHYVTRVRKDDGSVAYVDWTVRQFRPDAAYPLVVPERYESGWDEVHVVDQDGGVDWQTGVLERYRRASGRTRQ